MFLKVFLTLFLVNFSLGQESQNEIEEIFERSNKSRIVNGEILDIESVPYYVSLLRNGAAVCGGSIIHAKWILSAGHCVVSKK
jgi:secreted trypsin-like serine protease